MPLAQRFKRLSFFFSVAVSLIGLLVLTGWMGDITVLKSISPNKISMKANAAICFLLAGIIVILMNREKRNGTARRIIGFFSFIIFLIGIVTVLEYVFSFNAGIDELIFKDESLVVENLPPGRQSIFSAAYFMLFGFCYIPWVYDRIKISLFQLMHILSGFFVLASAMSYILGSYKIGGIVFNFVFVIHSTVSFLLLIMSVLFSRPDAGYMKLVSSNTTGGKIIRKTLPASLLIFIATGWLVLMGEKQGLYNFEFSVTIFIISMIVVFSFMLISGAVSLTRSEIILKQSEEQLKHLNENLEAAEKMAKLGSWEYNMKGQEGSWSKQIFRLFDLPISEKAPSFKEFLQLIHPEERTPAQEIFDKAVDGIEIEDKVFRTNPESGDIKYLMLDWNVIKDTNNKPIKYFGTLQCVTERVKARKKLEQSEELFKKAFHSKVFGLAIVNKERRVVDVNETITGLLGYSRENFIGKTSLEIGFADPEYIKKRDELLLVLLAKGKIEDYELDLITHQGKPISLLLSVEPLPLSGQPHWLIYLKDITEKKKAEKKLAESEKRLHTILQTEPECVKLIDVNGDLTYMNPAGLAMLEADNFEMVSGKKSFNCISEAYRDAFFQLALNVFKGHSGKLEYEITGLKGTVRMLETNVVPLRDPEEKISYMLGVTRDITENKNAVKAVRESEEKYRTLVEQASDGIFIADMNGRLLTINDSGCKLSGYTRDELLQMSIYDAVFKKDLEKNPFKFEEIRNGFTARNERKMKRKDGSSLQVEVTAKLMSDGNLLVFISDISERKKAEDKIKSYNKQLQQLTAHLQTVREEERKKIAREIHDDLGQHLTVLKLDIARLLIHTKSSGELKENISRIIEQADHCISRVRKIATDLRPTIIDDFGIIAALEWQAEEFEKNTKIKTTFQSNIEVLNVPAGHTNSLFRIFQESLTNVSRHSGAKNVECSLTLQDKEIILKIKDDGKGFDTALLKSKKTLGLLGMKERIMLLNGSYNIASEEGKGTEITVQLPVPV